MANETQVDFKIQVQQVFTTKPKHPRRTTINVSRKGSIVKEKCRQLTEVALSLFPERHISHEDLADLVKMYAGGDKETVRSYLGYSGCLRRNKRTGEGYVFGNRRKGYLELFGFMHKTNHAMWTIHAQMKFPDASMVSNTNEESRLLFKEKISLPLERVDCETVENRLRGCDSAETEENATPRVEEINSNNNMRGEREILLQRFSRDFSATPEELSILTARPYGVDPGRAKTLDVRRRQSYGVFGNGYFFPGFEKESHS